MTFSMGKFIGFMLICFVLVIFSMFFINTMGAVDSGVDMSGSDYEDQYNASTDAATITMSIIGYLPIILGVGLLLLGIAGLKKLAS